MDFIHVGNISEGRSRSFTDLKPEVEELLLTYDAMWEGDGVVSLGNPDNANRFELALARAGIDYEPYEGSIVMLRLGSTAFS